MTPHFYYPPAIVSRWHVHLDPIGGMQTQIYRMTKALSDRGIQQKVLAIGMKGAPRKWSINDNVEICQANIPIIPIRSRVRGTVGLNIYWGIGACINIIIARIKSFINKDEEWDLIHSHCSGVAAPLIVGLFGKWSLKKPLVYTVHCCRIGTYEPMNRFDQLINKYIIKIEGYCLGKADRVFTLTERTRKLIAEQYKNVELKNVDVVPDMIFPDEFAQQITQEKVNAYYEKFRIPRNKRIISYVGRIAHEKGWKYFLEAIPQVKDQDFHVVFAGNGNEGEHLKKLIKKYGLTDKVTVTGFIPNDLVAVTIYLSEFLVIPSIHEELGSVLLEAASLKKTVIASAVGGLIENVKDNVRGLLVEPKEPKKIAQKIDYLLSHRELGIQLGENLHRYIEERFSGDSVIDNVVEAYSKTYRQGDGL